MGSRTWLWPCWSRNLYFEELRRNQTSPVEGLVGDAGEAVGTCSSSLCSQEKLSVFCASLCVRVKQKLVLRA